MRALSTGIGFSVLVVVILFTWLMVATYVSPELAAFMGLVLVGIWVVFFVPLGFIREVIWQSRQQKIIQGSGGFAAYRAGMALPSPTMATGGGSSGSLLVVPEPAHGGALDVLRDLPVLPPLEPRPHGYMFKRSLVLPFIGFSMFFGANNDAVVHWLLVMRGISQELPVNWQKIALPKAYSHYESELHNAIRLTLRREPACRYIHAARLEARQQYLSPAQQTQQIADGDYVFELDCGTEWAGGRTLAPTFLAWVSARDLSYTSFGSLWHVLDQTPRIEVAWQQCLTAGKAVLNPLGYRLLPKAAIAQYHGSSLPFRGYLRFYGMQDVIPPNGVQSFIHMSCWVNKNDGAQVRFSLYKAQ